MFRDKLLNFILVALLVFILIVGFSFALHSYESSQPSIIGTEHIDKVIDPETRWSGGDNGIVYSIEMIEVNGYWVVYLKGESDEFYGYAAYGIYENMPSEEEIDILWTHRMPKDDLVLLMDEYGY